MVSPNEKFSAHFLKGAEKQKNTREEQQAALRQAQEAAARKAAEAAAQQEAKQRRAFAAYYRDLAPVLDILSALPPKDGKEFFVRTDLSSRPDPEDKQNTRTINIWILYTQVSDTPFSKHDVQTHGLAMNSKKNPEGTVQLALQDAPYLQLAVKQKGRTNEIQSVFVQESYVYAPKPLQSGVYRGDYRMVRQESQRQNHKKLEALVAVIGGWVQHVAPDRLPEIAQKLTQPDVALEQKIAVKKPLLLKPKGL